MKAAVLTVSDGVDMGTREDASGDLLEELLRGEGYEVVRRVVPDERDSIAEAIEELAGEARLVLTTGGTGLGPRDVTPEATMTVLERLAPGIAEAIRADSIAKTPHALLSRGVAGVRGRTLVVNLPGSTGGCRDGFAVLQPALEHALAAAGRRGDRPPPDVIAAEYPKRFASLVKIEHTVFALPFAYVGAFLAVDGVPSAHDLLWITVAMVGARSLAMGLNRLIDAGIDARNPRTATRELPAGRLTAWQVVVFCAASLAIFLRRRLPARPARALAVADPGRGLRDLPVPEALHLALAPLARSGGRARTGRRLGRDHGRAALAGVGARWGRRLLGGGVRPLLLAPRRGGRPARGAPLGNDEIRRGRRVLGRAAAPCPDRRAARRRGPRARGRRLLLARRRRESPRSFVYEHSLVRPGDLRRLDTAFFTMNGVISVGFFAFVLADSL